MSPAALIGTAVTLLLAILGATWWLSSRLTSQDVKLDGLTGGLAGLKVLPERVRAVETAIDAHTASDEAALLRIEQDLRELRRAS